MKNIKSKNTESLDSAGWKRTGIYLLNVNQSAQSYWGIGGENFLMGINSVLKKSIHHKKNKYSFDSYLDFELGLVFASSYHKFRKTTDRLDLTFEVEHSIGNSTRFNYGLLGNVNTQIFSGHNYISDFHEKISGFFTPGKVLLSFGLDYHFSNSASFLSVFVSPSTFRLVTKLDPDFYQVRKFGVDSSHKVGSEWGAYMTVHCNSRLSKTVSYTGRFDLFSNYRSNPQNIDILLNNLFSFNLGKKFAFNIIFDLLYDHDTRRRTQVQQVSGLGLKLNI